MEYTFELTAAEVLSKLYQERGYAVRTAQNHNPNYVVLELAKRQGNKDVVAKLTVESREDRERWRLASVNSETMNLVEAIVPHVRERKATMTFTNDMS